MPFLHDPVRKPTGHEPLASFVDRLKSGAVNYSGQPIVEDDRPSYSGRGPPAMATKVLPFPPALKSDIPLPWHETIYNANALHVPDIVSIGEGAAARAADRTRRLVEDMYVPRGHPGMQQLLTSEIESAERRIVKATTDMAALGMTPEEIDAELVLEKRALRMNAARLAEQTSGMSQRRMEVENAVMGRVGSTPLGRHKTEARLTGLHPSWSIEAPSIADAANGGKGIKIAAGLAGTNTIPDGARPPADPKPVPGAPPASVSTPEIAIKLESRLTGAASTSNTLAMSLPSSVATTISASPATLTPMSTPGSVQGGAGAGAGAVEAPAPPEAEQPLDEIPVFQGTDEGVAAGRLQLLINNIIANTPTFVRTANFTLPKLAGELVAKLSAEDLTAEVIDQLVFRLEPALQRVDESVRTKVDEAIARELLKRQGVAVGRRRQAPRRFNPATGRDYTPPGM